MQAAHLAGGGIWGSAGSQGAPSPGSGSASGRQSLARHPLPLTLPMVSSLAKLWVHQILVVLLPFFGLSAAAEGCKQEEAAGAGPSPGRGGLPRWVMLSSRARRCPPYLAAGDERGRGNAVQGLQALQHASQLLQLRLAL